MFLTSAGQRPPLQSLPEPRHYGTNLIGLQTRSWEQSQIPNFFDLKLCEAISHGLPSFDCYNLGGVVRQLGVDRMTRFAGQQINFSILSFDANGQTVSDAHSRALGVIRTAQVGGNVASHIENFASHENFLRTRDRMVAALRPFHQQHGHTGRDQNGRSELQNARPTSRKRDRPSAHNFLGQPKRRFDSAKLCPDRIVTLGLLSHRLAFA